MRWHLWLDDAARPGWQQMALDAALLAGAARSGRAVLRLYRWAPPCLSFGRHEPALRRYDRARIVALGLDTVRRPTGGRAVWHAEELTYAVAAPAEGLGALRATYLRVHETLAAALRALGAPATLAPPPVTPGTLGAGACFAAPAGGEVLVGGRKVVGSAQVREHGALLQHGSVLLGGSQATVGTVTLGPAPAGGETSLGEALGRAVAFGELAEAIVAAARGWGAWAPFAEGDSALAEAAALGARYRDPAWTWRR